MKGRTLASNRRYLDKELVFDKFLESGAQVLGTVKWVSRPEFLLLSCKFVFFKCVELIFCVAAVADCCFSSSAIGSY